MRRNPAGTILAAVIALCALAQPVNAKVSWTSEVDGRPFSLFGDGMVLQRDVVVPVWGRAWSREPVTVTLGSQVKTGVGDENGWFRVELDPMPAGGPYELTVTGHSNSHTLTNVMFGDVFLMAGQSNIMIKRLRPGTMAEYPDVRVFKRTWADRPGGIPWNFGRELYIETGVPIGVLQRGMRGSSGLIRTWMGPDAVNSPDPFIRNLTATTDDWGQSYEAVIGNVAGFPIKGVVWWQGEADMRRHLNPGSDYGEFLREVIRSWRVAWNQGAFPFHFLQEPLGGGFQPEQLRVSSLPDLLQESPPALMRQAYVESLSVENTTLITSADLVGGLHPRDREGYCRRIVLSVLARVYGHDITYAGPTFQSQSIEGNRIRLRFREGTADGLHSRRGDLRGFEIIGGGKAAWANAEIEGNEVVVWSDAVPFPRHVRYGYALDYTFANLFNEAGMAAPTFVSTAQPFPE